MAALLLWWHFFAFEKKLAKFFNISILTVWEISILFCIPIWKRRILLKIDEESDYRELDSPKLEENLLKLYKNNAESEAYIQELEEHLRANKLKEQELKRNAKQIEIQENKEFIKFLKNYGILAAILALIIVLKLIIF